MKKMLKYIIALICFLSLGLSNTAFSETINFEDENIIALQSKQSNSKKVVPGGKTKISKSKIAEILNTLPPKKNSLVKEEIQRYLGFETLFTRYFTVPYDITMNTNVSGYYIDIGFIILMFLPIIIFIGFKGKPIVGYAVMFTCVLLIFLSTTNGIIVKDRYNRLPATQENLDQFTGSDNFLDNTISGFYKGFTVLAKPVNNLLDNVLSGNSDYITYPILTILFVLLFLIVEYRLRESEKITKILAFVTMLFMFFWMLFAAGIIWYGYLMMPMCILFIAAAISKLKINDWLQKTVYISFIAFSLIWVLHAMVLRTSNIYKLGSDAGIHFLDNPIVKYQTKYKNGKKSFFDTDDVILSYFTGLGRNNTLKRVNQNHNNIVYSVGTMFPYFIEKNDERLISDNLLGLFAKLRRKYRDKQTIAKALRSSNIKFILINLQLHKIDKTPERSIEKKFVQFMNFIYENQQLKLLATDRVINIKQNGQDVLDYGVFGDIKSPGTYAIYEIN